MFFVDLDIQSLNLPAVATFLSLFLTLNFFLIVVVNFIIFSFLPYAKYIVLFPLFLFLCKALVVLKI